MLTAPTPHTQTSLLMTVTTYEGCICAMACTHHLNGILLTMQGINLQSLHSYVQSMCMAVIHIKYNY